MTLDIKCVTVYAFSIENFKRSPPEVEALMDLAHEKLLELCSQRDLLHQHGIRLNVLGRTQLLPPKVQDAVERAEKSTRSNGRAILNICMPYTAQDEICTAMQTAVRDCSEEDSIDDDLTEKDVGARLLTTRGGGPPLDLLVRTSGVKRLSDFLLWQCCEDTVVHFSSAYWPDFGLLDFASIILMYQRSVYRGRQRNRV